PGAPFRAGLLAPLLAPDGEPLRAQLLQLGDGAPLQEHVPVGALGLAGLDLRLGAVDELRVATAAALPQRRDIGLHRERQLTDVALRADVLDDLPLAEGDTLIALERQPVQVGAAQRTFGHVDSPLPGLPGDVRGGDFWVNASDAPRVPHRASRIPFPAPRTRHRRTGGAEGSGLVDHATADRPRVPT